MLVQRLEFILTLLLKQIGLMDIRRVMFLKVYR